MTKDRRRVGLVHASAAALGPAASNQPALRARVRRGMVEVAQP